MTQKIYQIITDRIIDMLDAGTVPWRKPWKNACELPQNLISKKAYRGINILTLGASGYGSPYWLTFKQAKSLGGMVRKGEKGTPVVFWKFIDVTDKETGEEKRVPLLRYYTVFNVEQTDGIDESKIPAVAELPDNFNPIDEAEKIIDESEDLPEIKHAGDRAFYRPSTDTITMPKQSQFFGTEEYYSTLFHECVHSTGHESRLDRLSKDASFGSTDYSKEELVAEMGAAMLCGLTGIETATIENSAAYIDGWRKKINDNVKLVITAAGKAQKAVDYILNIRN